MRERLLRIQRRMQETDRSQGRRVFAASRDIALGMAATGPPAGSRSGIIGIENRAERDEEFVSIGDQSAIVRSGRAFPGIVPSEKDGLQFNVTQLAADYSSFLAQSPAEVYKYEEIVGEFHWELPDVRPRVFPGVEELEEIAQKAAMLGGGGFPVTHTCADLSIGIREGWKGIRRKIEASMRKKHSEDELMYLRGLLTVCTAITAFIKKHAEKASLLAGKEGDDEQRRRYERVAEICNRIAEEPPASFHEGLQWVWFFIMAERMELGGNGYGRIDQYLYPLYRRDVDAGTLNAESARELICELYLKFPTFYSLGGITESGGDAVNELSYRFLEAYDMIGGANEFGVLWHRKIDPDFFYKACDVLVRKGSGSPALVNHEVLIDSETYYGVREEDAWNTAYSGCFWYCIPGKEWCLHDTVAVNGALCLQNALARAVSNQLKRPPESFKEFLRLYEESLAAAVAAMKEVTDWQFKRIPDVYPEMITSLLTHTCIERGRDISDGGVDYNSVVVQFAGLANAADSLTVINELVYKQQKISLDGLYTMLQADFKGYEQEHQLIRSAPKFGNDDDRADQMAVRAAELFRKVLSRHRTERGGIYRPAFFSWAGHAYAEEYLGAGADGRRCSEPISQGPNPMHGRNTKGITATARSVGKLEFFRNAGGPLQLEINPSIYDLNDPASFVKNIVVPYFKMNGAHVYINVISAETLKAAMEAPQDYGHIVVRVTGFSVHFVQLDRKIQEEIIKRTRHDVA